MGFNIKHVNKYMCWVQNNIQEYKNNCFFSKKYASICRRLSIALLLHKSDDVIDKISREKHNFILEYMRQVCPETIKKYQNIDAPLDLLEPNKDIHVWSMWWQGEEKADKLFRMCIDSARRRTGQNVIVLTKENYHEFFEIPDYIIDKYEEGKIQIQHICDLMVMSVMAEHGGFFTGATVWISQDLSEEFLRSPFFTCKAETSRKYFMSRSRWVGYVMAGRKDFPLFSFVRDCLYEYWKNCDKAVDYLMMDYLFELAYQTIPCVKEMIDSNPDNNLLRGELINVLGEEYNKEKFKRYTEGDTFLYKLSWKFGNKDLYTSDGKLTNYGHMLQECSFWKEGMR